MLSPEAQSTINIGVANTMVVANDTKCAEECPTTGGTKVSVDSDIDEWFALSQKLIGLVDDVVSNEKSDTTGGEAERASHFATALSMLGSCLQDEDIMNSRQSEVDDITISRHHDETISGLRSPLLCDITAASTHNNHEGTTQIARELFPSHSETIAEESESLINAPTAVALPLHMFSPRLNSLRHSDTTASTTPSSECSPPAQRRQTIDSGYTSYHRAASHHTPYSRNTHYEPLLADAVKRQITLEEALKTAFSASDLNSFDFESTEHLSTHGSLPPLSFSSTGMNSTPTQQGTNTPTTPRTSFHTPVSLPPASPAGTDAPYRSHMTTPTTIRPLSIAPARTSLTHEPRYSGHSSGLMLHNTENAQTGLHQLQSTTMPLMLKPPSNPVALVPPISALHISSDYQQEHTPSGEDSNDQLPQTASVTVHRADLWGQFRRHDTEMIASTKGRQMFPRLKFMVKGLDPNQLYAVWLHFATEDDESECWKWKASEGRWEIRPRARRARSEERNAANVEMYNHPDSPARGSVWMDKCVSFEKIRLTNNPANKKDVLLVSFRRYTPVLYFAPIKATTTEYGEQQMQVDGEVEYFRIDIAQFVSSTSYHNPEMSLLKIQTNPMANSQNRKPKSIPPQQQYLHQPHSYLTLKQPPNTSAHTHAHTQSE